MSSPDCRRCRNDDPVLGIVKARRMRGDRKGFGLDVASAPEPVAANDGAAVAPSAAPI